MKKKEFNFQTSFGYHYVSTAVLIKRLIEPRLQEYDLTHLQFSILMNLYKTKTTTQKELLKYVYGDEASVTRLVDRLVLKGYVRRQMCSEDKRRKNILLTDEGVLLVEQKLVTLAREVNIELVAGLEGKEAKELLKLLQKVTDSLERL